MDLLYRFELAFKTPVGMVLLLVAGLFAFFCLAATFLSIKNKRQSLYTLRYKKYFKETESRLDGFSFVDKPKADLWGKSSLVQSKVGSYGISHIPYPNFLPGKFKNRFFEYHLELKKTQMPYFPKNILNDYGTSFVNIESQHVKGNRQLMDLSTFCLDQTLTMIEIESLLIDLAHILEALHNLKTAEGETLYHGFLLPQSFYLEINMVKKITRLVLADQGWAFALGDAKMASWLIAIQEKNVIDPFIRDKVKKELFILAPEQRSLKYSVSERADYYSYAKLAIWLFTKEKNEKVKWEMIPHKWHSFLEACLQEDPAKRPQNFLSLKEYFLEPETALEKHNHPVEDIKSAKDKWSFDHLKSAYKKLQENNFLSSDKWQKGLSFIAHLEYEKSETHFTEMLDDKKDLFKAHLGLAITYYESGQREKSKYHYDKAKKIDSKNIHIFQKQIAFRI